METEHHITSNVHNVTIETMNHWYTLFGKAYPISGDELSWIEWMKTPATARKRLHKELDAWKTNFKR